MRKSGDWQVNLQPLCRSWNSVLPTFFPSS
ncbi:hypothetical protein CABS01_16793 [Colletotrichum abscissum]|nr:uncharacterized protein CABS01_17005 [Colletotrichum abscissum]XP_060403199.1 uncharacterized protein CABS01_16793 [Colletotrichum abscissum]KAK1500221.1 hypothetical protein CABS01_17005 [Colletotrichum abscissum]KAK1512593.1 hypothetical protein CABS01_16793 [Colletotrichum abscissum]